MRGGLILYLVLYFTKTECQRAAGAGGLPQS